MADASWTPRDSPTDVHAFVTRYQVRLLSASAGHSNHPPPSPRVPDAGLLGGA
jgi:hypothetical protein